MSRASSPHDNMFGAHSCAINCPCLHGMLLWSVLFWMNEQSSSNHSFADIMFNSWISQFCMMQLGVTLQKVDRLLCVWSIWVIGAAGHSCTGCRRQGKVWTQHELREPLFRKGETNQSRQDIWRAEKKGCEWLMKRKHIGKESHSGKRLLETCPLMAELQWCWR